MKADKLPIAYFAIRRNGELILQKRGLRGFELDRTILGLWKRYELPVRLVSALPVFQDPEEDRGPRLTQRSKAYHSTKDVIYFVLGRDEIFIARNSTPDKTELPRILADLSGHFGLPWRLVKALPCFRPEQASAGRG